jgi:hypothetical protein
MIVSRAVWKIRPSGLGVVPYRLMWARSSFTRSGGMGMVLVSWVARCFSPRSCLLDGAAECVVEHRPPAPLGRPARRLPRQGAGARAERQPHRGRVLQLPQGSTPPSELRRQSAHTPSGGTGHAPDLKRSRECTCLALIYSDFARTRPSSTAPRVCPRTATLSGRRSWRTLAG